MLRIPYLNCEGREIWPYKRVKKSRSRRDMRRSHDSLSASPVSSDKTTGSKHLRHHIAKDGFYRGKEIFTPKVKKPKEETAQEQ